MNNRSEADARGEGYAGSKSCVKCHGSISDSYIHTAHFRTSGIIKDLPAEWISQKHFSFNDSVDVALEKNDSGYVQVEYIHGKKVLARPINLVIGSGDEAASFGYWENKKVYQLPLSYFSAIKGWANSPGFPSQEPYFNRPVLSRCFECHSSFIADDVQQEDGLTNVRNLNRQSLIAGIDCERCHGPAANHVNFHTDNPDVKGAKYIVSWKSLPRKRKLDACAVCHSGNDMAMQQSTFWFSPGDTLDNYYFPYSNSSAEPDVHGKQMQLLASSRCFQMSQLECTTCHSPHKAKPGDLAVSSQPCLSCHKKAEHIDCPLAKTIGPSIESNCIDCHMPALPSRKISFQTSGKQQVQPYLLRTHKIAIYKE